MSIKNNSIYWDIIFHNQYKCKFYGNYNEDIDCVICQDSLKNKYVIKLNCGHIYHRNCMYLCLSYSKTKDCPDCRIILEKNTDTIMLKDLLSISN